MRISDWSSDVCSSDLDRGRVKRVYIQADAPFRMTPEDFDLWSVKNAAGQMVPFSAFGSSHWDYGSPRLERYDGVPSVEIQGEAAPGLSSGEAMDEIERLAEQLPPGFRSEEHTSELQSLMRTSYAVFC